MLFVPVRCFAKKKNPKEDKKEKAKEAVHAEFEGQELDDVKLSYTEELEVRIVIFFIMFLGVY